MQKHTRTEWDFCEVLVRANVSVLITHKQLDLSPRNKIHITWPCVKGHRKKALQIQLRHKASYRIEDFQTPKSIAAKYR